MAKYKSGKYSKAIDPSELWSLDVVMSEFILPRIKMLRALTGLDACILGTGDSNVAPIDLDDEELNPGGAGAKVESDEIYDQIIRGLELNIKNNTSSLSSEEKKEMEKGLCLLGKYYSSMWS